MSTVVKALDQYRFGWKQIFPFVGEVVPDPVSGCFSVEDEKAAQELVKLNIGFTLVSDLSSDELKEDLKTKSEEDELGSKSEEEEFGGEQEDDLGGEGSSDNSTTESKEEMIATLQNKTRKELEEMCKLFPANEWRGKIKEDLIQYIVSKL